MSDTSEEFETPHQGAASDISVGDGADLSIVIPDHEVFQADVDDDLDSSSCLFDSAQSVNDSSSNARYVTLEIDLSDPLHNLLDDLLPICPTSLDDVELWLCNKKKLSLSSVLQDWVHPGVSGTAKAKLEVKWNHLGKTRINIEDIYREVDDNDPLYWTDIEKSCNPSFTKPSTAESPNSTLQHSPINESSTSEDMNHMPLFLNFCGDVKPNIPAPTKVRKKRRRKPKDSELQTLPGGGKGKGEKLKSDSPTSSGAASSSVEGEPVKKKKRTIGANSYYPYVLGQNFSDTGKNIQLWQYLLELLMQPVENKAYIEWVCEDGTFVLKEPEVVAKKWGERKGSKKRKNESMSYENMSRALRYYYGEILDKVPGKQFTYRFINLRDRIGQEPQDMVKYAQNLDVYGISNEDKESGALSQANVKQEGLSVDPNNPSTAGQPNFNALKDLFQFGLNPFAHSELKLPFNFDIGVK